VLSAFIPAAISPRDFRPESIRVPLQDALDGLFSYVVVDLVVAAIGAVAVGVTVNAGREALAV